MSQINIINIAIVIAFKNNCDGSLTYWFQTRENGEYAQKDEFPGGKLEADESITQCAIREVFEETGVKLDEPELFHFETRIIPKDDKVLILSIFGTKSIEKFTAKGQKKIDNLSSLETLVDTLPPNYQIIRDFQKFILSQD